MSADESRPSDVPGPPQVAARARAALAALFFTNGAMFANLVTRYPDLKADLALSNAALGSAVAAYGLGALVVGLLAGPLVSRWGSARVATIGTVMVGLNLVLLALAPVWALLALAFLLAGTLDVVVDVAENAHGLRVERHYRRSILNAFHGWWSVGAVIGGAAGTAAAGLGVPLVFHLALVAGFAAAIAIVASRLLLRGHDDTERLDARANRTNPVAAFPRLRVLGSLLAFGLIAAMAQVMEDAAATWGSVYLRGELGAAAAIGGLGFVALQTFQTIGRLSGDRFVSRHGDRAVARAGAALAGIAMLVALAFPSTLITLIAFAGVGLGIGTFIPAGLRAADDLPGLTRGTGLTLVGTVLRIAVFAVPPLIGVVADLVSLRAALLVMPIGAVVVMVLARTLPERPARVRPA